MVEVKICGLTDISDARLAAACGANALGFIFYPGSPRYLPPARAEEMLVHLPQTVVRVGVFVNQPAEEIRAISLRCGLHLIQLHGDEPPDFCSQFQPGRLIKAFAPRSAGDLQAMKAYRVRAILLDTRLPGVYGGTGEEADWNLARKARKIRPLVLAGGLREGNVAAAVRRAAPRALDLNSGVEAGPGKKDPEKIRRMMKIIRRLSPAPSGAAEKPLFDRGLLQGISDDRFE